MTTISQSQGNDISLDANGVIALASGRYAYADIIRSTILTMKGELQLDTDAGVPYLETVFNNYGGISQWMNAVRSIVYSYDFVISIVSFNAEVKNKEIYYELVVQTDEGDITISHATMV